MSNRFFLFIALSVLAAGCTGQKGIEHRTVAVNAKEATHPERYTLVYALPKTTLRVTVDATQVTTRRGPYHQYAERYLGISGVPERNYDRWLIDNIRIESYQEADPDQYYLLETNDRHVSNFFKLSTEGFILPVNQKQLPDLEGHHFTGNAGIKDPLYTDLSIHPLVVEETRTVMRMVRQDTAFVNVPVLQRQSVTKNLEARAAEVADLIFELRSNRFKLVSGDLDLFPDGRALEAIIDEFNRQEKEYLGLFTGKVYETHHQFTFDYTPGNNGTDGNGDYEIIFRFSETDGVLSANDVSGRPVTLEITAEGKTANLERLTATAGRERRGGKLYYRVPESASVRIVGENNNTLASRRVLISQYGKLVTLPADFLWE